MSLYIGAPGRGVSLLLCLLVVTLALVVPVRCVCVGDEHLGQSLHFVFPHVHLNQWSVPSSALLSPVTLARELAVPQLRHSDGPGVALSLVAGFDSLVVTLLLGCLLQLSGRLAPAADPCLTPVALSPPPGPPR